MRSLRTLRPTVFVPVLLLLLSVCPRPALRAQDQEDLAVFHGWRRYADAQDYLYDRIAREAYALLDARDRELAGFRTSRQWRRYTESVGPRLAAAFGPLWDKNPLAARVVDSFSHHGLRVEKIIFESRPGYQVTAAFYKREDLEGRLPAVLYVCGHTADGFRSDGYQHVSQNLALKGFAVLAIDPPGQGERFQYFDSTLGKSRLGGMTAEHSYAGLQLLMLGRTMAASRLWDGVRAVDYLCSRPDVDPARIAVQGRSGGGTMSAYLGAMEPRIAAAAPECYLTSFRRLFQSIGPQDAEQNLLRQIASGLDHGDFVLARAPRPTLMVTTTRDMFSIQGARETFAASRPAFKALGAPDNLQMVEDDAPHQSTRANREKVYAFFMHAFGVQGSAGDLDIELIAPEMLKVSKTGQVITSGSRNIHDLILDDAAPVLASLARARSGDPAARRDSLLRWIPSLSGMSGPGPVSAPVFAGRFRRAGYSVEKVVIDPDGELPLPALVFVPDGPGPFKGVLWLDSRGKATEAAPGEQIESLVADRRLIVAVDLPGTGELAADPHADDSVIHGVSYNLVFGAQLIGRSVTGIQAGAVGHALDYLLSRPELAPGGVALVARGTDSPAALHAAAFNQSVSEMALLEAPLSWESILSTRWYSEALGATVVPSALLHYDLPDLAGLFAPRPLLLLDPLGGDGQPASGELKAAWTALVKPGYGDSSAKLRVESGGNAPSEGALREWLGKNGPSAR